MIYNSRKYPPSLFVVKSDISMSDKGFLVLYSKNKLRYIGKLSGYNIKGMTIINTNWRFAETIEYVSMNDITHISKNIID
jgi:hypothetical protein